MARRKSKTRTLQPAVMKLHFAIPQNQPGEHYISISHSVSRLNRRFYRQGLNWAVANCSITMLPKSTNPLIVGTAVYVNTLPHTWATANAWMKSYSLWKRQQDEAIADSLSEDTIARFRDFKISMEVGHTVGTDLTPTTVGPGRVPAPGSTGLQIGTAPGGQILPSEEWVSSQIVVPNDGAPGVNTEYGLHMVGPDVATSKGMIQGYADSRAVPQSPDPSAATPAVETSWMQEMFDVGGDSSLITDNAEFRNNELPYDQVDYPGGDTNFIELECQGYKLNQSTVGVNTFNTGPFTAPCGLIRIDIDGYNQITDPSPGDYNLITVELVPGNHRGYLCETMEEF